MKRFSLACLIFITIAAIPSCNIRYFENPEFGDIIFDPSIAVPIGEISYSVEELFEELNDAGANVGVNDENVVTLTYQETLQSQSASTFLEVVDQNFGASLAAGVNISNPPISTVIDVQETFEFDLTQTADESYDSLLFKSGVFNFTATTDINADISFTATFISLEDNGTPFVVNGNLTPGGGNFVQQQQLAGFRGLFHRDALGNPSSSKFIIRLDYSVTITPATVVNATDRLSFNLGITNTTFERVYGNVGNQSLAVNFQVVNLDFFDNFDAGNISFADPRVTFIFDNSFGFPLGIDFQEVAAIGSTGAIVPLQGDVLTTPQIINAPTVNQEGEVIRTEIQLNAQNSNIDDLISSQPRKVIVEVQAESNPTTTPAVYNFINDQSILDVFVDIEIPLELNINALTAEEVVNFTNGEDLQEAKQLLFRVIAENELPLGGLVELQFRDAEGNVILTIDERAAFSAAPVGADGRTTETAISTTDVMLTDSEIRIIENASSINVVATLTTTEAQQGGAVKFFNDYELKFRLAAQADVEINSNGN